VYIHLETAHLVLKKAGSPGHDAGGPMHFAFVTSTEKINELAEKFASLDYRTRGPFDFLARHNGHHTVSDGVQPRRNLLWSLIEPKP